jgi:hypothetical protein
MTKEQTKAVVKITLLVLSNLFVFLALWRGGHGDVAGDTNAVAWAIFLLLAAKL